LPGADDDDDSPYGGPQHRLSSNSEGSRQKGSKFTKNSKNRSMDKNGQACCPTNPTGKCIVF